LKFSTKKCLLRNTKSKTYLLIKKKIIYTKKDNNIYSGNYKLFTKKYIYRKTSINVDIISVYCLKIKIISLYLYIHNNFLYLACALHEWRRCYTDCCSSGRMSHNNILSLLLLIFFSPARGGVSKIFASRTCRAATDTVIIIITIRRRKTKKTLHTHTHTYTYDLLLLLNK